MERYEEIPHTADLAARIFGKNTPELFENAAFAMFDMMANIKDKASSVKRQAPSGKRQMVNVKAADTEGLLIAWLNELLYLSYEKKVFFRDFKIISLKDNELTGEASTLAFPEREERKAEIKAATYHDVRIEKRGGGYEVTVVFDV